MQAEFWLEKWEAYEIGFHQQEINAYLKAYWPLLKLNSNAKVFVPLCGKSRDLLWLLEKGHQVIGIELSPIAIRHFFEENGMDYCISYDGAFPCWEADNLIILEGDFFKLNASYLQDVSAIFDRASLVALPPELRQQYVRHLQSLFPKAIQILLVAFEYDQDEMNGPPFSISDEEIQVLYQNDFNITQLFEANVLNEYPKFSAYGLKELLEKVYLLTRQV